MRRTQVAVAVLWMTPALLAAAAEGVRPDLRGAPMSDAAALELSVRATAEGEQWLGPYSRYGWRHPGPAYLLALVPSYEAWGRAPGGLHLGASLIGALALLGMLLYAGRLRPGPSGILAFVACMAPLLLRMTFDHPPALFAEIWNPVVTILPYGLVVLASARGAQGSIGALAVAVLAHAFVTQTHVGYLPAATAALAVGVVGHVRTLRDRPRGTNPVSLRKHVGVAVLALLCWLPPLIDQVAGHGNLGEVLRFFATAERDTVPASQGLRSAVTALAAPLLGQPDGNTAVMGLLAAAGVGLLSAGVAVAWVRARSSGARAAVSVGASQLVVAALSAFAVDDVEHRYLVEWLGMAASAAAFLAIASGPTSDAGGTRRRAVPLAAVTLAAVVAIVMVWNGARAYARLDRHPPRESRIVQHLVDDLTPIVRRRPAPPLAATHDAWDWLAAVVLELERRGVSPTVRRAHRKVLGSGVRYAPDHAPALVLANRPLAHHRPVLRAGPVHVMAESPVKGFSLPAPLPRVIGSRGLRHDPSVVADGRAPKPGKPRAGSKTLWMHPDSSLTLALPPVPVRGLRVTGAGARGFAIDASIDGVRFEPVGRVEPEAPTDRVWTRETRFAPDAPPYVAVRLRPLEPRRHHFLAEVSVVEGPGFVLGFDGGPMARHFGRGWAQPERAGGIDFAWVQGRTAALRLPVAPARPHHLEIVASPFAVERRSQRMEVFWNGRSVAARPMAPRARTYRVDVPALEGTNEARARLRFAYTESPADLGRSRDRRRLSARLMRLRLTPMEPPTDAPDREPQDRPHPRPAR